MMATLLLRLSAPMQAWGTQSNFTNRDTGREPSKSGVIGLLCAALGRPRSEPIDDLAGLKMGVRIDQEGVIRRDFHTAGMGGIYKVDGKPGNDLVVSQRYFLSDARFLVGLEGKRALLEELQNALQRPRWLLFFGRKSFVPAERVWLPDGIREEDVITALGMYNWLGSGRLPSSVSAVVDDPEGTIVRNDLPLSFDPPRFVARTLSRFSVVPRRGGEDVPFTVNS
jgi:CRISPR system Cascade subunit CasD